MHRVCIGIHVFAEPARLHTTLASLRSHTTSTTQLLLLPDGPDETTSATLATLSALPQLGTVEPLGAPACFNRLVASTDADVFVFLESGAIAAPGWLDYLLAALDADPRHGLAGPSTNHAWNEQCVGPPSGDTPSEVARTGAALAQRFGPTWRTLEPLYSLADFCYMVRREVVQAVGAADEGYGLGPCWEMDYNIRAARAGFQGVWACAAYVHRAPFPRRRRRAEAQYFEASKHRYQDKFCALRLSRARTDYAPHCCGEACEHFAPATLMQVHLPLPAMEPLATPTPETAPPPALGPSPPGPSQAVSPLVSCIMPTRNRVAFVLQSIRYFQRQDYPNCELIIVDDGTAELAGQLPDDPRIRYICVPPGLSIGAKRNRACELAHGSIIAHWDDDDWYAPKRLSAQVAPLLSGAADISGLNATNFFVLDRWEFWRCTPQLHRRLFLPADVHCGTLVYRRHIWEQLARYPNRSLAEDAVFLQQALGRGARLCAMPGEDVFLYLRHASNSWSFTCGHYLDPQGWQRVAEPALLAADRTFYTMRSSSALHMARESSAAQHSADPPLVSCIMPTADRRAFIAQAITYFLQQDYPNRELIIVDDGANAVADLIPPTSQIRYLRLKNKRTIGAKRNLACQEATGTIIVHWDDDDWMAPWRLSYQVAGLCREQADICGLDKILYCDPRVEQAWQYIYRSGGRPWVAGNTLCYTKAFWQRNPFPDVNVGEDTRFVWSNQAKRIVSLEDGTFYIAIIHAGNVSAKITKDMRWHTYPIADIQHIMEKDWSFYVRLFG
jgi:glycosyltransferase involved in cell wall biosynthesis